MTTLTDSQKIRAIIREEVAASEKRIIEYIDHRDGWLKKLLRDVASYAIGLLK